MVPYKKRSININPKHLAKASANEEKPIFHTDDHDHTYQKIYNQK